MASSLTLQNIRDLTRQQLDLDSDDLPDALLDSWAQEGFDLAIAGEKQWRFYEVEQSFSTSDGTQAYTLAAIDTSFPLETIYAVRGPRWNLIPIDQRLAEAAFNQQTAVKREPNYFSIWGGQIILWPTPDATYSLTVRGHRQPLDWIATGAGANPDCPEPFHRVILQWCLSRAYLQQDDPQAAQYVEQQFGNSIRALRARFVAAPTTGPLLVNQGEIRGWPNGRLRYDFE